MTNEEKEYIWDGIEAEGFDYYFTNYTSYDDCGVKDKKLKKLWENFEFVRKALEDYVKPNRED